MSTKFQPIQEDSPVIESGNPLIPNLDRRLKETIQGQVEHLIGLAIQDCLQKHLKDAFSFIVVSKGSVNGPESGIWHAELVFRTNPYFLFLLESKALEYQEYDPDKDL